MPRFYGRKAASVQCQPQVNVKRPRITISRSVVELWEGLCQCTKTHNVTFETSDGQVTAHDLSLGLVLFSSQSMREDAVSQMKSCSAEGVAKSIACPGRHALRLFGGSPQENHRSEGAGVITLKRRILWQA